MLIRKPAADLRYSDVTPKQDYLNRRRFLAGSLAIEALASRRPALGMTKLNNVAKSPFSTTEKLTSLQNITTYNSFYEFDTDKEDPSKNATNFRTSPWEL